MCDFRCRLVACPKNGFLCVVLGVCVLLCAVAVEQDERTAKFSVHWSKIECNITDVRRSMCVITNAYYWKEWIYVVIEDPQGFRPFVPEFALPYAVPMPPLLKAVTPSQLSAIVNGTANMLNIEQGILFYRLYVDNFYHHMWEIIANIHVIACKMFNKCSYDPNERQLQLFYFDRLKANRKLTHAKLLKCITANDFEEMYHPDFTLPARIAKLTLGLGAEAMGQQNVVWHRRPPPDAIRQSLQHRMRACMQLPATVSSVADLPDPVVTIVLRPRGSVGRSISNVEELRQWVTNMMPGFKVLMQRMEGKSPAQQAEIWSRSSVVVSNHGAQLSNAIYMPNRSVMIEVDQLAMSRHPFYKLFVVNPLRPFLHIEHFHITPDGVESVNISRQADLLHDDNFKSLTPEQQQQWLKEPHCKHRWITPQHNCRYGWSKTYTDVIVKRETVEGVLVQAKAWLAAQGVAAAGSPGLPQSTTQVGLLDGVKGWFAQG